MPDETIFCPECKSKVKVPDSLMGQPVTCPVCRHTFAAPLVGGGMVPSVLPASPMAYQAPGAEAVKTPAIVLLIVGILGSLMNIYALIRTNALGPEGLARQNEEIFRQIGWNVGPMDPQVQFQSALIVQVLVLLFALGTVLGAVSMLRLRWYGLAVTGSILAMLNFGECCCLLGLPVGIWSLIVLMRPEVRQSFS
jgi:hypothetical protein